ncbi:MAG: ABC transporter substrate-binding protein [Bacteriovoracia bacterium]
MRKTTLLLAALTAAFFFLAFWSFQHLKLPDVHKTTLRLTLDDKVESLDPARAYSDDSLVVSAQVLEPLYQYHYLKRPYEIEPLVAEGKPVISNQGKTVRVKIRKNIFFHPHPAFKGKERELLAEDFITQFKRLALKSLRSPGRGIFTGLVEGFEEYGEEVGEDWKEIASRPLKGVSAIDSHTLEIRLTRSEPNIVYYLALNFLSPVPWEIVKYSGNKLDDVLVGTGPYVFRGFHNSGFEMEKNRNYREAFYPTAGDRYANVQKLLDSSKEQIPFIDNVIFYVAADEKKRWEKFFNKEIDLLTVPKTFIPKLYNEKGELTENIEKDGIIVKHFPNMANRWLAFNMKNPLVGKNEFLRRAIAYSINYEKYISLLSQNTNLRANSILVPGIAGYLPAKEFRFKYDPALAKEYLKLAGFKSGKLPTIIYSTRGNQAINLLEADFIKEHLEAIGLKVKINVLTFSEFLKKGRAGELMFFTDNWFFDYPDGENILQLLISSNSPGINKSSFSNAEVDALYMKLKETITSDEREKIIHRMEQIVFDNLPWIPMMYESSFVIQYPEIKNYRKSNIIRNYVKYLKIER